MLSQRKYRATQKAANNQLQVDVQSLERTNLRLEARRAVLHDRLGVSDCIEAIHAFGQLLERGKRLCAIRFSRRRSVRGISGAAFLLETWAALTLSFGSVHNYIQDVKLLDAIDRLRVRVTACLRFEISASTIEMLFPHLVHRHHDLVDKLVGTTLELSTRIVLDFEGKRVTRLELESNAAAAFVAQHQIIEVAVEALGGEIATEGLLVWLQQLAIDES
ncbi:Aste57867_18720 [Aphanomyces stellatus]|uniref:Aste57867_18720 protein n=1 Tax=Aphanomyces stellatus TaxID=120398 RepID=A0A485LB25_9STRA|nr:hypothetical protein As57867_018656 [Aphanomyces stellatus]VFT95454.1 Aste57867_18720 [Aphanomyces stellatus]